MPNNTKRYLVAAGALAVAGFMALACEHSKPLGPATGATHVGPVFDREDDDAFGMTGSGKILSPSSLPKKYHQVFGIHIEDENLDGVPEGKLVFEDKNPANRLNNKRLKLRSVSWSSIVAIDGCADAGIDARGVLVIKNTGEQQPFRVIACDNGEPGRGRDVFRLDVFRSDGSTRFSWSGTLIAGNLQAHGIATTVPPPSTGTLDVTTTTGGSNLDADGYTVTVDGTSQAIGINDTKRFSSLAAGNHTVQLSGMASNCTVAGNNPRTVSVSAGMVTTTTFNVTCSGAATTGTLSITTVTTGTGQPAGYTLTITGPSAPSGTTVSIGANANFSATVTAGTYSVQLNGVPTNCTLSTAEGPNPRSVTVPGGGTGSTTFSVSCTSTTPTTGTLSITTATTGTGQPTGYTLTITGPSAPSGATVAIGASATFTQTVDAGTYTVQLNGVPTNCTLSTTEGPNPRSVTVPGGGTGSTTFSVSCTTGGGGGGTAEVVGQGQIGTGSPGTLGSDATTFDFDIRSDLTGRFTGTDWADVHGSSPAMLTTDPVADPATSFTAYRNSSSACTDPSHGVEVDAIGREDTGGLVAYTMTVCDNGPAGSGTDFWGVVIPSEGFRTQGTVTSGDVSKR